MLSPAIVVITPPRHHRRPSSIHDHSPFSSSPRLASLRRSSSSTATTLTTTAPDSSSAAVATGERATHQPLAEQRHRRIPAMIRFAIEWESDHARDSTAMCACLAPFLFSFDFASFGYIRSGASDIVCPSGRMSSPGPGLGFRSDGGVGAALRRACPSSLHRRLSR